MAVLKTPAEIETMAEAGRKLAEVLELLRHEVRPGVPTEFFDERSRELISVRDSTPAFLNYLPRGSKRPYPATICVSVNDTVVHGLPSQYLLKEGDLVKLDLGLKYEGFYVDAAITVGVGDLSAQARKLVEVTEGALYAAIEETRPLKTLGDIGAAVAAHVSRGGFSVVEQLTGHGIGRKLHESPNVLNAGRPGEGEEIVAGMVLAIEPMVAAGSGRVKEVGDGSFVTADGSLAAHFEHTVAITDKGPRILTSI